MGETSAKLRQIFDLMYDVPGVYLFDEFDAIGGARTLDNDVGEMRRVLNAFLQFIEKDTSDSVIFCATNSPELLDQALFRRYDDVLHYTLPDDTERKRLVENVLGSNLPKRVDWNEVMSRSEKLSHAEIDLACRDTLKQTILSGRDPVDLETLGKMLDERKARLGS
jgi:AAA+ superfamily predicted ATPase